MEVVETFIPAQSIIDAQKQLLADLQHQNLLYKLTIQNMSGELQAAKEELNKFKPKESAKA